MRYLFQRLADNTNPDSLAVRMRRGRIKHFNQLLENWRGEGVIEILDLGGDPKYWANTIDLIVKPLEVVLLNIIPYPETGDPRIHSVPGNALDLSRFEKDSFDVVYSNSLIEHVGSFEDQRHMAGEIRRVGRAYYVQTPNRYFPIEPHFLLPFFQYYPRSLRVYLARNYQPGWYRSRQVEAAIEDAESIRLLTKKELQEIFPDGIIWQERLGLLTKSFVVYQGFFPDQFSQDVKNLID